MKTVLVMIKSDGERREFPLSGATVVIGRRPDCTLRIPTSDVSRKHCQIALNNGSIKLKDLGSSNGTFVNEKRVLEVVLKPGDRLRVGPVLFVVQIDGQPAEIPAPTADEPIAELSEADIVDDSVGSGLANLGAGLAATGSESDVLADLEAAEAVQKPAKPSKPRAAPTAASKPAATPKAPAAPGADVSDLNLDELGLNEEGDPFAGIGEMEFDSDIDILSDSKPDQSPKKK